METTAKQRWTLDPYIGNFQSVRSVPCSESAQLFESRKLISLIICHSMYDKWPVGNTLSKQVGAGTAPEWAAEGLRANNEGGLKVRKGLAERSIRIWGTRGIRVPRIGVLQVSCKSIIPNCYPLLADPLQVRAFRTVRSFPNWPTCLPSVVGCNKLASLCIRSSRYLMLARLFDGIVTCMCMRFAQF